MTMRASLLVLSIALVGCPSPDRCPGAPENATVSIDVVAGAPENVVVEGGPVAFVRGIQGSDMAVFRVAYASPEVSGCLRRDLVVRSADGATLHTRTGAIEVEREGDLWIEPEVQVIEPPGGPLVVEVEAYDTILERTVVPTGMPRPVAFDGPTAAAVGAPVELTLGFDRASPSEIFVEIAIEPADAATVEPFEVYLPYGASEVPVVITPTRAASIVVTARTYDEGVYEATTVLTSE